MAIFGVRVFVWEGDVKLLGLETTRDEHGEIYQAMYSGQLADNADLALMPDMYVDASIDTGTPDQVVSVPESAVLDAGGHPTVFVDKGEGRFEPRNVKVGRRGAGYVEIPEGVADGENVVVAANFLIDAESNLKAALKSFSKMGASQ